MRGLRKAGQISDEDFIDGTFHMPLGHDGLISAPRDYLTILVVRYPRDALMTKRLFRANDGATDKTSYGKASVFDAVTQRVNGLGDVAEVLYDLSDRSDRFVIRGQAAGCKSQGSSSHSWHRGCIQRRPAGSPLGVS